MVFSKPMGIFAVLDEESRFPKATGHTLLAKLAAAGDASKWTAFKKVDPKDVAKYIKGRNSKSSMVPSTPSKASVSSGTGSSSISTSGSISLRPSFNFSGGSEDVVSLFRIEHYAGTIAYDTESFLEKNRDTLSSNMTSLLQRSANIHVSRLFTTALTKMGSFKSRNDSKTVLAGKDNKISVSATFKSSLADLMTKMQAATPYFVRCLKPNRSKKPDTWDADVVLTQLRYTGLLETIKVRRDGYAVRMRYSLLTQWWVILGSPNIWYSLLTKYLVLRAHPIVGSPYSPNAATLNVPHLKYSVFTPF